MEKEIDIEMNTSAEEEEGKEEQEQMDPGMYERKRTFPVQDRP